MTCIVGFVHGGCVHLGGDRAAVSDGTIRVVADPKVFRLGELLIGYTSSFRMGQLLQYRFTPPVIGADESPEVYLRTAFIDGVRAVLAAGGYAKVKEEQESAGTFLVGFAGALWHVDDDFQVTRFLEPYAAVGSGAPFALGAFAGLFALPAMLFIDPNDVVVCALKAAAAHNVNVRGPFDVVTLPRPAATPAPSPAPARDSVPPPSPSADATGASA